MIIPIIRGTTEIIEKVKNGETIINGCPDCESNLVLKQFRVWGTLFMIPMAPRNETRFVYECVSCLETFDPAYRNTFINQGKYRRAAPEDKGRASETMQLTLLTSVLCAGEREESDVKTALQQYAEKYHISTSLLAEQIESGIINRTDLSEQVFDWYSVFRDAFPEADRNLAFDQVLAYCCRLQLTDKEKKLLYTYARHWGLSKVEFDERCKGLDSPA